MEKRELSNAELERVAARFGATIESGNPRSVIDIPKRLEAEFDKEIERIQGLTSLEATGERWREEEQAQKLEARAQKREVVDAKAQRIKEDVENAGGSPADAYRAMNEFYSQDAENEWMLEKWPNSALGLNKHLPPNPGMQYVLNPDNWPSMGATAGSIAGSRAGNRGSIAGSSIGGMLGEGARQLTARDEWTGLRDAAVKVGKEGGFHGALEGAGAGIGAVASRGARWAINNALRGGLKLDKISHWLRGTPSDTPITSPNTWEGRFPTVRIADEVLDRNIPVTHGGLTNVELELSKSAGRESDLIRRATDARVPGQRLLTAGSELENLGPVPVPSGGRSGISNNPSDDTVGGRNWWATNNPAYEGQGQPIYTGVAGPDGARPPNQYFSGSESSVPGGSWDLNPPYSHRSGALGDIVAGPGSWSVPRDPVAQVGPRARLIPGQGQMIEPEEALAPAIQHLRKVRNVVTAKVRQEMESLIAGFMKDFPDPSTIAVGQQRKKYYQDQATDLFNKPTRKIEVSAAEDKFYLDVAKGYKKALELRVPGLGDVNKETQVQYAIYQTLLSALNREALSPGFSVSGFINNPRVWGKIRTALSGVESLANVSPNAIRALFLESLDKFDPSVGDEEAQVSSSSTGTMGDILPSIVERIQNRNLRGVHAVGGQTVTGMNLPAQP